MPVLNHRSNMHLTPPFRLLQKRGPLQCRVRLDEARAPQAGVASVAQPRPPAEGSPSSLFWSLRGGWSARLAAALSLSPPFVLRSPLEGE